MVTAVSIILLPSYPQYQHSSQGTIPATMPVSLMFGVILFCEKSAWFKASPRRLQFILAGRVRMAG